MSREVHAPNNLLELGGLSGNGQAGLSWCVGGDGLVLDGEVPPTLLELGGVAYSQAGLGWCVGGDGLVVDFGAEL